MRKKSVVLLVLDSVGIGALPDAEDFGDAGSNTLGHVLSYSPDLTLPALNSLGLGHILLHPQLPAVKPLGSFGRGMTRSLAKDTITGHWELMGIIQEKPFRTFPKGFSTEIVKQLQNLTGRTFLGNTVASGTEIIAALGKEHVASGSPILYTSADSVMQIAAHEEVVPLDELYDICLKARELMQGEYNVARIIARPFVGDWPYQRTPNRKDYAVLPPQATALDMLLKAGIPTTGIGKVCDIYARQGLSNCMPSKSNKAGMDTTLKVLQEGAGGLIFTNLVEFDSHYGHRNDPSGYGQALKEADNWLEHLFANLDSEDWLFVVADHGCDPTYPGTDHTREYVPILAYNSKRRGGVALGDRTSLADVGATIMELFDLTVTFKGTSFRSLLEG